MSILNSKPQGGGRHAAPPKKPASPLKAPKRERDVPAEAKLKRPEKQAEIELPPEPEIKESAEPMPSPGKKSQSALLIRDLWALGIKIFAIITFVVLLFSFVFGIYRCGDPGMNPSIKDGDLIIYYRLDKRYSRGDALVAKYKGQHVCYRVAAVAGDVVDMNEDGLIVNGGFQYEEDIYEKTERFADGIDFPVTLQEGEVFVLGDSRGHATDSRIFGPVKTADSYGKVIGLIRRRGL